MHQTWSKRERGNGEQSSRGVGRVGTMAAVNSRDKNRLEKRSSRRAWCTFGRHFLSSASARCAVAHVRLRWRRRRRLVAVGENFLFSSLAWQLGRRKGVFLASAPLHTQDTEMGLGALVWQPQPTWKAWWAFVNAWSGGYEAALQSNDRQTRRWSERDPWRYPSGLLVRTRNPRWKTIKRSGCTSCLENEGDV